MNVLRRVDGVQTEPTRYGHVRVSAPIRGLVRFAAAVAGPRWAGGYHEWLADLHGDPNRQPPGLLRQLRVAGGLLVAALRMRAGDLARWSGRRLDWALATHERIFSAAVLTVGAAAVVLITHSGDVASLVQNASNLAVAGAGVWAAGTLLRRIRRIADRDHPRPDDPKPDPIPPPQRPGASDRSPRPRPRRQRRARGRTRRRK